MGRWRRAFYAVASLSPDCQMCCTSPLALAVLLLSIKILLFRFELVSNLRL